MSDAFSKDIVFEGLAELGLALSNKYRLQILSLLTHGPKTGEQLVEAIGQSKAVASAHLKVLRHAGLITTRKEGKYVWYSLSSAMAERLWLNLRDCGEKILPSLEAKLEKWDEQDPLLSTMTPSDLAQALKKNKVFLIDLRPNNEFHLGHIPQAMHAPYAELSTFLHTLKTNLPILTYCRGPYCQIARQGTSEIAQVYPDTRRLRFSVPEWRHAGYTVEE